MSESLSDARQIARYEELMAKQAIAEQNYLYCRAMDRIDRELGRSIWHPDGIADYGPIFKGPGFEFIDWVCTVHAGMLGHSHQVTNILAVIDGARAASESYITAALRQEVGGKIVERTVRGLYLDRWSNRAGHWAIDERRYVDAREIGEQKYRCSGARNRTDPVYTLVVS